MKVHFQTGPLSTACCPESANVKHLPLNRTPDVARVTCLRCQQTEAYVNTARIQPKPVKELTQAQKDAINATSAAKMDALGFQFSTVKPEDR